MVAQDGDSNVWWHLRHNRLRAGARYGTVTGSVSTGATFVLGGGVAGLLAMG